MEKTPSSLGFYMPAEWELHEATWISWPKNPETYPPSMIGKVEESYCKMVAALSQGEKVKILVDSDAEEGRVEKKLLSSGVSPNNIIFLRIPSSDVWMRDYGPTFLLNHKSGKKAAVRWVFNAWGEKYDDLMLDNGTGDEIAKGLEENGTPIFRPGIVMEGGSIDSNGKGMLLTTEQCLLNRNRNPNLSKQELGQYLMDYLGVSTVIWLKNGIDGDDTDGHVDDFARFVGERKVICSREKNKEDSNSAALEKAFEILAASGLETVELPMPKPIIDSEENRRLPASYANFYIGNKCVLMPIFNDKSDSAAAEILQECFPKREIIPIEARELVYGYGGIHCVTQQEPKAKD